jgi:hypothetical protein
MEDWKSLGVDDRWTAPVPGRVVSCFNKSAELCTFLFHVTLSRSVLIYFGPFQPEY